MTGPEPEVWRDKPPAATRKKWRDPEPGSPEGQLLARLRGQPGRLLRVAEDAPLRWWFRAASAPVRELRSRRLIVTVSEPTGGLRAHVWARALTPDEMDTEREIEAIT